MDRQIRLLQTEVVMEEQDPGIMEKRQEPLVHSALLQLEYFEIAVCWLGSFATQLRPSLVD